MLLLIVTFCCGNTKVFAKGNNKMTTTLIIGSIVLAFNIKLACLGYLVMLTEMFGRSTRK
jgi:hypothetical protein